METRRAAAQRLKEMQARTNSSQGNAKLDDVAMARARVSAEAARMLQEQERAEIEAGQRRNLRRCLRAFAENTHRMRVQNEYMRITEDMRREFLFRWFVRVLQQYNGRLAAARKAARAMMQVGLRRGMTSWMALAAAKKDSRRKLASAASEWMGGKRRACWFTWREAVTEIKLMQRAAGAFKAPALKAAVQSWVAFASEAGESKGRMTAAINSLK